MPFYEYQCQACGAQVEVLQKISDPLLKKCPECGKSKLRKLVSAPVFRLKGAGWYETDFKSDKENKRNLVEAEKGETKVEEKPAEKAEKPAEKAPATESKPADKPDKPPAKPVQASTRRRGARKPAKKPPRSARRR